MEPHEIVDLVGTDSPSSEVSDAIKQALLVKSAARIDAITPDVANALFGNEPEKTEDEVAPEAEAEIEVDASIDKDQETEQEEE
tara:strand:+ start:830 stop:1081 length:252 start_codon:yes stop_codon:yes gene_type:complete